jgi:hypothetical protein
LKTDLNTMPDPGWSGAADGERRAERMDGPVTVSGRQKGGEKHKGKGRKGKQTETKAKKRKKKGTQTEKGREEGGIKSHPSSLISRTRGGGKPH